MKHFHAHIYFNPEDLELAKTLAERARLITLFELKKLHEKPVGPHPSGMIEIHFREPSHAFAVDWIEANRGSFPALIHEDTGDDLRDHTEGSRWLGPKVPLDFSFFDLIQARPDLRIHPLS